MTPKILTAQDIVDYLESVQAVEPDVLQQVLDTRFPCGAGILEHPHTVAADSKGQAVFGALGLIQGLVGMLGEVLEAQYDADDRLIGFRLRQQPGDDVKAAYSPLPLKLPVPAVPPAKSVVDFLNQLIQADHAMTQTLWQQPLRVTDGCATSLFRLLSKIKPAHEVREISIGELFQGLVRTLGAAGIGTISGGDDCKLYGFVLVPNPTSEHCTEWPELTRDTLGEPHGETAATT